MAQGLIEIIAKTGKFIIPPGWLEVICERCGVRCYIGPKQRESIKKVGYNNCRIFCNSCEKVDPGRAVLADEVLDNPLPK